MTTELLTRREAAEYLKVKPQTLAVWKSTKCYDLPCTKVGGLAMYRKTDLDAWIESRTERPTNEPQPA